MAEGGGRDEAGSAKQCQSLAFISRNASLTLSPSRDISCMICLLPVNVALLEAIIDASSERGVGS
jgi:hypothetical protein